MEFIIYFGIFALVIFFVYKHYKKYEISGDNEIDKLKEIYDKVISLRVGYDKYEVPYVAFDNNKREMIIKQTNMQLENLQYEDIIGVELIEDGKTSISVGSIVGGSLLAGNAGAVIGGMNKKNMVNEIAVKISLNNFNKPSTKIIVNRNFSAIKKNGIIYNERIGVANEVIDTAKYIINNKQKI